MTRWIPAPTILAEDYGIPGLCARNIKQLKLRYTYRSTMVVETSFGPQIIAPKRLSHVQIIRGTWHYGATLEPRARC